MLTYPLASARLLAPHQRPCTSSGTHLPLSPPSLASSRYLYGPYADHATAAHFAHSSHPLLPPPRHGIQRAPIPVPFRSPMLLCVRFPRCDPPRVCLGGVRLVLPTPCVWSGGCVGIGRCRTGWRVGRPVG